MFQPMLPLTLLSSDSILSALRLPETDISDAAQSIRKFTISVAFIDFKDLAGFCKHSCIDAVSTSFVRTFWISWIFFDKTFQSEEFTADIAEPPKVRDTVRVKCSEEALIRSITGDSSMRIFLCTQGSVLAAISLPLFKHSSHGLFPLTTIGWYDLDSSNSQGAIQLNKPAVKLSIIVDIDSEEISAPSSSAGPASRIPTRSSSSPPTVSLTDKVPENFAASNSERLVVDGDSTKGVRFSVDCDDGIGIKKSVTRRKSSGSRSRRTSPDDLCETSSEDAGDSHDESDNFRFDNNDDDEADDYTRHYRVNVEVKSIGGLKRAANAAINFTYPYLGAGRPVRTHPIWLPANTEGRVDGCAASYDCCMSRNRIRDILSEHPLKISAVSRTNLGSANIGEVVVDLFGVMEKKPHSYRCAMTSKTFKSREEYVSYRQSLLALRSLGQIERVPSKDPVTVWADDSLLPLTADRRSDSQMSFLGGQLRVVVVLEEISIVGAEIATSVTPGYKMHNGALYVVKQASTDLIEGTDDQDVELPPQPLDRVGLSESERITLEKLKSEWDVYRMASEVQWRNSLKDREMQMRVKLESESSHSLAERADDLRRAQEEAGRLEVRLRGAIDEAERQKSQLRLREEQMQMTLAQKSSELQLLQRRVRDEAKARIDAEVQKSVSLESQITVQKQQIERYEKRVKDVEKDYESFRAHSRGTPESILREELSRIKGQLSESRAEVERERRIKSEAMLEKEHYRAQMHRLAVALKREREKSSASARQDLDQLRLEFLAREERYVLDGDREELRNIRHELANLRSGSHGQIGAPSQGQRQGQEQGQGQGQGLWQGSEKGFGQGSYFNQEQETITPQQSLAYLISNTQQQPQQQQQQHSQQQQQQQPQQQQQHSQQQQQQQQHAPSYHPLPYSQHPSTMNSDLDATLSDRDKAHSPLGMDSYRRNTSPYKSPDRDLLVRPATYPTQNLRGSQGYAPSSQSPTTARQSVEFPPLDSRRDDHISAQARQLDEMKEEVNEEIEEEEEEELPRIGVRKAESPPSPVPLSLPQNMRAQSPPIAPQSLSYHVPTMRQSHPMQATSKLPALTHSSSRDRPSPSDTVRMLQMQIQDLLDTGVYEEDKDPILMILRKELAVAVQALGSV